MSDVLPRALIELIESLSLLPGVGQRTAERYAYYIFKHDKSVAGKIAQDLNKVHDKISVCPKTFALIDAREEYSKLYTDPKRNKALIAVVAEPFDIIALEKTGSFNGTYHVLGGLISPLDGIGPEQLHINALKERVESDNVIEIIIATNASVEGETTAMYIQRELAHTSVIITRLARGIPIGVDLEYADQMTLTRALEGRTAL